MAELASTARVTRQLTATPTTSACACHRTEATTARSRTLALVRTAVDTVSVCTTPLLDASATRNAILDLTARSNSARTTACATTADLACKSTIIQTVNHHFQHNFKLMFYFRADNTCACPPGFTGDRCETASPCLDNPCVNGYCAVSGSSTHAL